MTAADEVVAVDVGTSAVRAAVVSASGAVTASARVSRAASGGEFFDAETLLEEVTAALAQLAGARPRALAISAHIGTVAVDESGCPVDRAGGWSDPRGLGELASIPSAVRESLLSAGGRPALTGGALAYALSGASGARYLLSPKDFLVARLTGAFATDTVDAAYTLLSEVRARRWHTEAMASLGIDPALFPPQAEPTAVVGELARDCGLPAGTPVVAGGPDGSVGIGLLLGTRGAAIADVAGTTDVVGKLVADPDAAPARAMLNPALVGGRWVAGGASGMTGGAVAHWRSLVGAASDEELAAIPPGADGLFVLPTLTGSRFPRWRASDRGAVLGQRPEHAAAHLLRAAQEGAAFTVREGLDLLDPDGTLPVALAGGTARSLQTAQVRADVTGRVTHVCTEPDVTLLGAAALALVGSGLVSDVDDARARLGCGFRSLDPNPARAARYRELFVEWAGLRGA
ncbi:xylulose kinase [Amycolatopsis acidicola]|uniref:Xylulose kinase n=1 Tax=Amycolatopsis acidicola TaxID=2596893 RepID=A0A5N0UR70_9PSEU|nr:FGGY family carbohydrate kinase [Amycolatopsis acidicola]KAA9153966.1 xylulose kinase [Amycolatopsis acidicola]